ncbi:MAG TPA: class I SAM-dependent methyltransferase [Gemmatimonadales bacterium]
MAAAALMSKVYDKAYFDRWYHDPKHRQWAHADVARKVLMALAVAEFLLDRPVRSVLDVGCGEGTWQPILAHLRPKLQYTGVESSEYAIGRFGRSRHLLRGSLGTLGNMDLRGPFDLVVCCDMLHYVPTKEVRTGLAQLFMLARGPAYLEAYTSADDVSGDHVEFQKRSPADYRRLFRAAGFVHVGPHCYLSATMAADLVELEKPAR